MSRSVIKPKWKAGLALVAAIALGLIGLPLTLVSLAGVVDLVQARLAGFSTGKDTFVILLLVASLWLLKLSRDLWRDFRELRTGVKESSGGKEG